MRYPASEKLEIIRLVEQSHLPVRRTLAQIRIPRSTLDQYQTGGPEALDDRSPRPDRVWGYDDHPDVATLIGYASRKHGRYDDAKIWYERALAAEAPKASNGQPW